MITTIAQACAVIEAWHRETTRQLERLIKDSGPAKAMAKKRDDFALLLSMLKAIEHNPRLERVTLSSLQGHTETDIRNLFSFPNADPQADQLHIRVAQFKDKLTDIVTEIRARHYYITIHLFDRSILYLLNRMSAVITQIEFITTEIQKGMQKPINNANDRKAFAIKVLKYLRGNLYPPLRSFYLLKNDLDFYALSHDWDRAPIIEIEAMLKGIFDAICEGKRSILLDANDELDKTKAHQSYSVKEVYDNIITQMPTLNSRRQATVKEILAVLNDITFSRNTFSIPSNNNTESLQARLIKYAVEECDGELLLPLSQMYDPNVANDDGGLCNGYSNSFIFQLAVGTGFFSLVNKMGPVIPLDNTNTSFHFYSSSMREVNLQNNSDYSIHHQPFASLDTIRDYYGMNSMPPVTRKFGGKKTSVAQMKTQLEDELKNYNDAFLKLGFWEKGEKVGHAISICRLDKNGPIHFMDNNNFYIRFKSLTGFLKFYDRYEQECIPQNLGGINLKTYYTEYLRPTNANAASSISASASSSSSAATLHPMRNMDINSNNNNNRLSYPPSDPPLSRPLRTPTVVDPNDGAGIGGFTGEKFTIN